MARAISVWGAHMFTYFFVWREICVGKKHPSKNVKKYRDSA